MKMKLWIGTLLAVFIIVFVSCASNALSDNKNMEDGFSIDGISWNSNNRDIRKMAGGYIVDSYGESLVYEEVIQGYKFRITYDVKEGTLDELSFGLIEGITYENYSECLNAIAEYFSSKLGEPSKEKCRSILLMKYGKMKNYGKKDFLL